MNRLVVREYEPSDSETSLVIADFQGGYGRSGSIWLGIGKCTVCGEEKICIGGDGSECEYFSGEICRECAIEGFDMFSSGMRGETESVTRKRKSEWDEDELERVANEKDYDEECIAHQDCKDPDCKSRVHPIISPFPKDCLKVADELPGEKERKGALAEAMTEPIRHYDRDTTKVDWREGAR